MNSKAIRIGGVLNLALTLFHALFSTIFHWQETLTCLSPTNRAILYALNNHTTLVVAAFAYVSFAHADELCHTPLGRLLSRLIAVFYILRLVEEWTLFSSSLPVALGISAVCGLLVVLYLVGPMERKTASAKAQ